ncbi:MAG: AMP-binding protein, partial [Gammaproteobacteria bacterium]
MPSDHRSGAELALVARARLHGDRTAIMATDGTFTYGALLDASARVAGHLAPGGGDLAEQRVALLAPPSFAYVAAQWGIWRAGGVVVPLATSHPPAELEYTIRDAEASAVMVHPELAPLLDRVPLDPGMHRISTREAMGT